MKILKKNNVEKRILIKMKWRYTNTHASYHVQSFPIIYLFIFFIAFIHTGANTFHILQIMYDILKRTSPFSCMCTGSDFFHWVGALVYFALLCAIIGAFKKCTTLKHLSCAFLLTFHWLQPVSLNILWILAYKSCIWFSCFVVGQFSI